MKKILFISYLSAILFSLPACAPLENIPAGFPKKWVPSRFKVDAVIRSNAIESDTFLRVLLIKMKKGRDILYFQRKAGESWDSILAADNMNITSYGRGLYRLKTKNEDQIFSYDKMNPILRPDGKLYQYGYWD